MYKNINMHILSLELLKDYRTLPSGLVIDLKPVTLLVGEQGCGKSSLLKLLQANSPDLKMKLSDYLIENEVESFYFDTETMNPRMVNAVSEYSTPSGESRGIGLGAALASHFKSHGETLREFTVNRIHQTKNCVLLMDEPESALSLKNQYRLAEELIDAQYRNVQLIIATHCLPVIESVEEVYSLEHHAWINSKDFIEMSKTL